MTQKTETVNESNPKLQLNKKKNIFIIATILLFLIAIGLIVLNMVVVNSSPFVNLPITTVHGIFVDMNQDGRIDYVPYAQVILNPDDKPNFQEPTQIVK
jgi:hypothetical protein